jgi:hypothetical protein
MGYSSCSCIWVTPCEGLPIARQHSLKLLLVLTWCWRHES